LLILGGTGMTGGLIARFLLNETSANLVLAGRRLDKAQRSAADLNRMVGEPRVSARSADAAEPSSLSQAFQGMDWIIAASSTAQYARNVAEAALQAGANYLDVQFSTQKYAALRSLESEIQRRGLCFITDGGFHPGLPAALVRWAALRLERLETANIGSVIQIDWRGLALSDATLDEMVTELMDTQSTFYRTGRWQRPPWWNPAALRYFEFGPPFGRRYAMAMHLEEMRTLPEAYPSLVETGFFVGGFNWFVDYLVFPLLFGMLKLAPHRGLRPGGRMLLWGLRTFSRPPYGTLLKLEAHGQKDGHPEALNLLLSHPDGYVFTAIPVVACLLQCLDGSAVKPGLWAQAWIVEPERLLQDMQRMGIQLEIS
jgi:saccharopine dehydrogenase (NAD+, L-lysine-forming)